MRPINSLPAFRLAALDAQGRRRMLAAVGFTFLFKLFEVLPDILLGLMIDAAFHKSGSMLAHVGLSADLSTIFAVGATIFVAWAACSGFQFVSTLFWKRAASSIQHHLRLDLCRHVLDQQAIRSAIGARESLRSDYRANNFEIDDVEFFVHRTMEDAFRIVFSVLIVAPILFAIAPMFLLYAVLPIGPTVYVARSLQRRVRPGYNAVKQATKAMHLEVDVLLGGFETIKDFGVESRFFGKVKKAADHLDRESVRTSTLAAAMSPATRLPVQLGLLAILVHGVVMVYHGELSFGGFAAASFLSRKFLLPFTFLGAMVDSWGKGTSAFKSLQATILSRRAETPEPSTSSSPTQAVRFESVSFFHGERCILRNLSLVFEPGVINVVKGPTGSGKSTLLRIIKGDFEPESGRVSRGSDRIGFVPQFPKLFTASLRHNVTLFDEVVDETLLALAIHVALIDTFVGDLPNGLETIVGPNAVRLSGGQIQCVAIARAFYSDARVLLIDEPTANLDPSREETFLIRLRANLGGRVLVMTSHREQPIRSADFLIDLANLTRAAPEKTLAQLD